MFGEHSGRRGGATTAFSAGLQWVDIKRLGRWRSDSAVQNYLDPSAEHSRNNSATFARAVSGWIFLIIHGFAGCCSYSRHSEVRCNPSHDQRISLFYFPFEGEEEEVDTFVLSIYFYFTIFN